MKNIIGEISINYRPLQKQTDQVKITDSKSVASFLRTVWSDKLEYIEEFYLLLLNRNNRILGYVKLSEGGTSGTVVDPKMVFQAALKANAHGIIMCHNHPSGNLKPSEADIALTKRIKEAGRVMDIEILDHLILTVDAHFSFTDEGML